MEIQVEEQQRGQDLFEEILARYGSESALRAAAARPDATEAREDLFTFELLKDNPKRLRAVWRTLDILQLEPAEIENLTEKRLILLDELQRSAMQSNVTGLAQEIGRDKKNVSRDLKALASLGLVKFHRRGREAIPLLAGNVIRIDFRRQATRRKGALRAKTKNKPKGSSRRPTIRP